MYTWGYHSSDEGHVHVSLVHDGGRVEDLFDVALYDPEVIDPDTGRNCRDQSLHDLERLIALANTALDSELRAEITAALEGDSNDAEHDALASVAAALGIEYRDPSDVLYDE